MCKDQYTAVKDQLDGLCASMVKLSDRLDEKTEKVNDRLDQLDVKIDRKKQISDELKNLIEVNGRDAVLVAFKQCVGSTRLKEMAGYTDMLKPSLIQNRFDKNIELRVQLTELSDLLVKLEDNYKEAVSNLNTMKLDIKMAEANAIANAPATLKNAAERDAFRRQASSFEREKLADAEDTIETISSSIRSYKYKYEVVRFQLSLAQQELELLGSIFKFLA